MDGRNVLLVATYGGFDICGWAWRMEKTAVARLRANERRQGNKECERRYKAPPRVVVPLLSKATPQVFFASHVTHQIRAIVEL